MGTLLAHMWPRVQKDYGCSQGWIQGFHSLDRLCPQGDTPAPPRFPPSSVQVPEGHRLLFTVARAPGQTLKMSGWVPCHALEMQMESAPPTPQGMAMGEYWSPREHWVLLPAGEKECWSEYTKYYIVSFVGKENRHLLLWKYKLVKRILKNSLAVAIRIHKGQFLEPGIPANTHVYLCFLQHCLIEKHIKCSYLKDHQYWIH